MAYFSAVSGVEMKNFQISEQVHFSQSFAAHRHVNISLFTGYYLK